MVMRRRGGEEESRDEMLQSSYQDHLSYGHHHQMAPPTHPHHEYQPHHPSLSWYNNYLHTESGGSGSDFLAREEKTSWSYTTKGLSGETPYAPAPLSLPVPPPPPESGQYSGVMMGMESPLMMQESSLMMSPDQHHSGGLLQNGTSHQPPPVHQSPLHPSTGIKEEEESLPKLDGPQATPVEPKKDVLKLPGFHQTFGNITEIGRFSQPDEFFESRPPEIPDPPPPKVSEAIEAGVKRKPRGRKRKPPPEPRELYGRQGGDPGGPMGGPMGPGGDWGPASWGSHYHHHHHHPYYGGGHYHHPMPPHHPSYHTPYYEGPPGYPHPYYPPAPWHPHPHSYSGYV